MTTRMLPREEWPRLADVDLGAALKYIDPEQISIVVVEHHGQIVGCWSVLTAVHLEGLWIHPAYRKRVSVARRLLAKTLALAREKAGRWAMTGAQTDEVRRLLEKVHAVHIPMETYVVPLES